MVTACGGVVCDGRRGPRDQYVCWGIWTTWVGGGQQPLAADWPAATLTPRPLPHTLAVQRRAKRLYLLPPNTVTEFAHAARRGLAKFRRCTIKLPPDGTHVPSVIVQKRFRFGEAAR
ncbi:hypothetical protein ALC62_04705 [Cyphomyrmex costatus]|uniref:Uncharacterized protein n=1 Tax=Cyphomyrmex costatus TaxID=456900 RepID=A0A195CUX4_9HYME|nr:hypothetical protein ALC62_04705 [Cyphomyrmex costatus]